MSEPLKVTDVIKYLKKVVSRNGDLEIVTTRRSNFLSKKIKVSSVGAVGVYEIKKVVGKNEKVLAFCDYSSAKYLLDKKILKD